MTESFYSSSPLNDTFKSTNLLKSLDMSSRGPGFSNTHKNIDKLLKIINDDVDIEFELRTFT